MNSKSIYECLNCNQHFCAECSDAASPTDYCSDTCQIEQTALNEPQDEPLVYKLSGLKSPYKKKLKRS
jgi:hypothetical protein